MTTPLESAIEAAAAELREKYDWMIEEGENGGAAEFREIMTRHIGPLVSDPAVMRAARIAALRAEIDTLMVG
jgi:hypothetical protein